MDEPLGALDEQTKMLVQDDLLHLWEGTGKTVVFITHSIDEAVILADRVAVMSHRPGRIKAVFEIDLPRPRTRSSCAINRHSSKLAEGFGRLARRSIAGGRLVRSTPMA